MAKAAQDCSSRYVCDHCGASYTAEEYDELETVCVCNHLIVPRKDEPLPCSATSFAPPPPARPAKKAPNNKARSASRPADATQPTQLSFPKQESTAKIAQLSSQPGNPVQSVQPDKAISSPKKAPPQLKDLPTPNRKRAPRKPLAPEGAVESEDAAAPPGRAGKRARRADDTQLPLSGTDDGAPPAKAAVSRAESAVRKNSLLAKYLALPKSERDGFVSGLSLAQQMKFATQLSAHDAGLA